jgi:hypothetical protein
MERRRFERFDPVTVRAAARVIRISWLGRVSEAEVFCYLLHLADLQPGHGPGAVHRLWRLGRHRAALGDRGVPTKFRLRRSVRSMPGSGLPLIRTAAPATPGSPRMGKERRG